MTRTTVINPNSPRAFAPLMIPGKSKVFPQRAFCNQAVTIPDNLDLDAVLQFPRGKDLIRDVAAFVIKQMPSTQEGRQAYLAGIKKGYHAGAYDLSKVMEQGMATCFFRAVYFNLAMNRLNIPCTSMDGTMILSQQIVELCRQDILHLSLGFGMSRIFDPKTSQSIEHTWNVAYYQDQYVLIDTAWLDGNKKPLIVVLPKYPGPDSVTRTKDSNGFRYYFTDSELSVSAL